MMPAGRPTDYTPELAEAICAHIAGDKESRADLYAAQVQGGNVYLVQDDWNRPFMSEYETFPAGQYKDQVDAAAGAFMKLNSHKEFREQPIRGLL